MFFLVFDVVIFVVVTFSQYQILLYTVVYVLLKSVIVIIQLILSVWVCPKAITLKHLQCNSINDINCFVVSVPPVTTSITSDRRRSLTSGREEQLECQCRGSRPAPLFQFFIGGRELDTRWHYVCSFVRLSRLSVCLIMHTTHSQTRL
jgi:hypothetical protein